MNTYRKGIIMFKIPKIKAYQASKNFIFNKEDYKFVCIITKTFKL